MACVCFSLPVLRNCFYSLNISLNKATQVIHSVHSSQSIEVYSNARAFLSPRYSYAESQLILDLRLHLCIQNRVGVLSLLLYSLFVADDVYLSPIRRNMAACARPCQNYYLGIRYNASSNDNNRKHFPCLPSLNVMQRNVSNISRKRCTFEELKVSSPKYT